MAAFPGSTERGSGAWPTVQAHSYCKPSVTLTPGPGHAPGLTLAVQPPPAEASLTDQVRGGQEVPQTREPELMTSKDPGRAM